MKNMSLFSNKILHLQVVFAFLISLLCWSCSSDDDVNSPVDELGEFNTKTLQHEGIERTYHVYLPSTFDKSNAGPLVLALHGGGGTGKNFPEDVSAGTMVAEAESRGVVLVMPEGVDKRWNSGRPEIFNGETSYNDVGFISSLIDTLVQEYGIDAGRVYATGISNGGFMSFRLALELSNKIAAIAPVTAQIAQVHEDKQPQFPVSLMLMNGTEDPLVPYNGGQVTVPFLGQTIKRGEVLSTEESINKFIAFNQCPLESDIQLLPNTVPNDGTEIEITTYSNCSSTTEVILVKVIGGGHTWPSGAQYLPKVTIGNLSEEINASKMIFDFFLKHSRN